MNSIFKKTILVIFSFFMLYSCNKKNQSNEDYTLKQLTLFKQSIDYKKSANKLIDNSARTIKHEDLEKIEVLLNKSLETAKMIDLKTLDNVVNGLSFTFKNKYIRGLEYQLKGMKDGDAQIAVKGQIMQDDFFDWLKSKGL